LKKAVVEMNPILKALLKFCTTKNILHDLVNKKYCQAQSNAW